jgi:uncharacterized paraquat-inducible protein A
MDNEVRYKIESLDILKAEQMKIQRKYVVSNCDKCNMTIQVEHWDLAHRNYCIPCGLTKLGELDGLHS